MYHCQTSKLTKQTTPMARGATKSARPQLLVPLPEFWKGKTIKTAVAILYTVSACGLTAQVHSHEERAQKIHILPLPPPKRGQLALRRPGEIKHEGRGASNRATTPVSTPCHT